MNDRYLSIDQFQNHPITGPTVLIVEPNPYHGEILPGFVYLFQRIGYTVHLLMRSELIKEDPFIAYPAANLPKIYTGTAEEIKAQLLKKGTKKYDIVFFSTNVWWEGQEHQESYLSFLGSQPQSKYGSLYIEHNLMLLEQDGARQLLEEGRVFALLEYKFADSKIKMINPHYFGDISYKFEPSIKKKILILGSSSRDEKNLASLFISIRQILKVSNNHDFAFYFVGSIVEIPHDLKSYVTSAGRLDFDDYFKLIEECDYLLTLIDRESKDIIHTKYSHGTTTGTVQISLGFAKPMIIDELHAGVYDFNNSNAILYEDDLTEGLSRAINIKSSEYSRLVGELKTKSKSMDDVSKHNLKNGIKLLKNSYYKNQTQKRSILKTLLTFISRVMEKR